MRYALLVEIIGWIGTFLLLTAYVLVSFKKLEGDSIRYQMMNVVAGLCLVTNTLYHGAYPPSFLNAVWSIIAVVAIITIGRKSGKNTT
ncbi:MAG: hypothetical protein H0T08_02630 [Acidobacteria bacterium]|nr:hypothetical protein [Acidobacteriota bacterium]